MCNKLFKLFLWSLSSLPDSRATIVGHIAGIPGEQATMIQAETLLASPPRRDAPDVSNVTPRYW
jgi:hypothetical protein